MGRTDVALTESSNLILGKGWCDVENKVPAFPPGMMELTEERLTRNQQTLKGRVGGIDFLRNGIEEGIKGRVQWGLVSENVFEISLILFRI